MPAILSRGLVLALLLGACAPISRSGPAGQASSTPGPTPSASVAPSVLSPNTPLVSAPWPAPTPGPPLPVAEGPFGPGAAEGLIGFAYEGRQGNFVLVNAPSGGGPLMTWRWNGTGWLRLYPATPLIVMARAAMAYDEASNRVILFSGAESGSGATNATWAWDGTNWTQLAPRHTPPVLYQPALAYHAARQQLILFGATFDYANPLGGLQLLSSVTWAWDGSDWTELHPAASPSPRYDSILAYDGARNVLVLAGGSTPSGPHLQQTWTWDGTTWTLRDSGTVPTHTGGSVSTAYDPQSKKVMAFRFAASTWAWDGTRWLPLTPSPFPSGFGALALDTAAGQLSALTTGPGGTVLWRWDGSTWAVVWPAAFTSWRTYTGARFALNYPPYWYAMSNFGPEYWVSNENVGAPLALDRAGGWIQAGASSGPCYPLPTAGQTPTTLGGIPAIRRGYHIQTERGGSCYSVGLASFQAATSDALGPLFDQVAASFKFL